MTHTQEKKKKQATETAWIQLLYITEKDFEMVIINILEQLKKTVVKEVIRGTRLAQSVEHTTLDLGVIISNPMLGVAIT